MILCFAILAFFYYFICKALGLGFFYYKVMIFFFIFFGLSPKFETNQASQPPAPPCPPNLAWKDKEWTKVGSKWKHKVGFCIVAYYATWLLIKDSKESAWLGGKKGQTWETFNF